jgi:hypothetical protein
MKKILFLLVVSSCIFADDIYRAKIIMHEIHDAIEYVESPETIQSPATTMQKCTGDCADMSALMIWRIEGELSGEASITRWVNQENGWTHATVLYKGIQYDPANDIIWIHKKGWTKDSVIKWNLVMLWLDK